MQSSGARSECDTASIRAIMRPFREREREKKTPAIMPPDRRHDATTSEFNLSASFIPWRTKVRAGLLHLEWACGNSVPVCLAETVRAGGRAHWAADMAWTTINIYWVYLY